MCVRLNPSLTCRLVVRGVSGGDAAGAPAARRPPHEEGGGHGAGLGQRDHDPHALPPEGEHHQHLQTGRWKKTNEHGLSLISLSKNEKKTASQSGAIFITI